MKREISEREERFRYLWEFVYDIKGVVIFDASLYPSYILIDNLLLEERYRRIGTGKRIMTEVCRFADRYELDVLLFASEDFGTPIEVLCYFYGSFNFKTHSEYYYDGEYADHLLRRPTIKEISFLG